jgi:hypothetical protein
VAEHSAEKENNALLKTIQKTNKEDNVVDLESGRFLYWNVYISDDRCVSGSAFEWP